MILPFLLLSMHITLSEFFTIFVLNNGNELVIHATVFALKLGNLKNI